MRGLTLFITDIRKCRGKEEELQRINKELANIRNKFHGNKPLNGYDKKKYLCKLLFMFLLGHKCEIGYIEAINLLSSNVYSEKQIGYLFISVVMKEKHDFVRLVINSLKNDLSSTRKGFQNLALQFIANCANEEIADSVSYQVLDILLISGSLDYIKQSAALALLQLSRMKSDLTFDPTQTSHIIHLISSYNLGVVTASISLIDFLVKKFPSDYDSCLPLCCARLYKLVNSPYLDFQDYSYYSVTAPWLSVKFLRLLQNFSAPKDLSTLTKLQESLVNILNKFQEPIRSKRLEQTNAKYAVIFEAVSCIIHMNLDSPLLFKAINTLGNALNYKEANIRLMSLDMMAQLTDKKVCQGNLRMQWNLILETLKTETDVTIKKRAIDLLCNISNKNNVKPIVEEILHYLESDTRPSEETVLKVAALSEKFNIDLPWYVDTTLTLLQTCGNYIDDGVWYTLTKVVTDNRDVQEYAARASYKILCNDVCHDKVIKAAGYILGEFGYLIAKDSQSDYEQQLKRLHEKYPSSSPPTRALLLTTYMKIFNIQPNLKDIIQTILKANIRCENVEIQQRAVEYLRFSQMDSKMLLAAVFAEIPSPAREKSATFQAIERRKSQEFVKKCREMTKACEPLSRLSSTLVPGDFPVTQTENKKAKSVSFSNVPASKSPSNLSLLLEAFNEKAVTNNSPTIHLPNSTQISNVSANENFLYVLLFNDTGVLFEDNVLRILVRSEFKMHFGRLHLTYENKSSCVLTNLTVDSCFTNTENKCSIWFKPVNSELQIEGSMKQIIHLECLHDFSQRPHLLLKFICWKEVREVKILLPLTINKFTEPVTLSFKDFKEKWESLSNQRKVTKEFRAKYPMIYGVTRQKLLAFRVHVVENFENVSSTIQHFYCVGLFHTNTSRTGFLLSLEGIPEANRYRLTARSRLLSLSQNISDLLLELL